jgi:hypothetical protein
MKYIASTCKPFSERVSTADCVKKLQIADNKADTHRALNHRVEVPIADNDKPAKSRR